MNTISSLFNWIGNLIGANPSTLTTTSKTLIGAINEVDGDVSGKVDKSGDTMTGDLVISTSESTSRVRVATSATNIALAAQNGGHHGLWSVTLNKWLLYGLTGGIVKVNETEIPASATLLTDSTSSATATKVGNYYSGTGIVAMRNGGCVTVKFAITATANITTRTTIANIPAGYRPMTEVFGFSNAYNTYFIIQDNGNVKIDFMENGRSYYGMAVYSKA